MVAAKWFIWKAQCNFLLRNDKFNPNHIGKQTIAHIRVFSFTSNSFTIKNLFLTNFSDYDQPFLFSAATWNEELGNKGEVFFLSNSKAAISTAGCSNLQAHSKLDAEIKTFLIAIKFIIESNIRVKYLFINSP